MRYLLLFVLPLALSAQSADQQVTQALVTEIQALRQAIERSTLLNARTQLSISQMQLQEATVTRVGQQLNDVRMQGVGMNGNKTRLAQSIKDLEQERTSITDPLKVRQIEAQLKQEKFELEQATAFETNRSAHEGELISQFQAAQAAIAESRARIAEMERALDAAIQQMLRK